MALKKDGANLGTFGTYTISDICLCILLKIESKSQDLLCLIYIALHFLKKLVRILEPCHGKVDDGGCRILDNVPV